MSQLMKRELKQLVAMIGMLQDHLESAIDTSLVQGTAQPDPRDRAAVLQVARDRRDWQAAEAMVKRLEALRKERL